jgi:nitrite reductase/ring-hydroxylating ferredoxin subunit
MKPAYGRQTPPPDYELTCVEPGSPMGELLRRYWQPVCTSDELKDLPRKEKLLCEEIVFFRDKQGRVGALDPHCAHRGTSLEWGRIEERGIRCCYHGWLFDVQGHCLDQPCEPEGGRARDKARQPWYPVQELYGLLWAYMGPPEKKPVLPRYECLELLEPGEFLEADDHSIGGGGPQVIPCNWLQHYENIVDPFHVVILHSSFSGTQFVPEMAVMPQVTWDTTEHSVRTLSKRQLPDGRTFRRISEAGLPTLRVVPSPRVGRLGMVESLGWVLPIDDQSFRIYVVGRVREAGELHRMRSRPDGKKLWEELTEAEHQLYPGDYEAMVSQGAIARHSEEHLASTDRGLVMLRRLLQKQLDAVKEGRDPAGVFFDPATPPVKFSAGNWMEAP